MENNNLLQSILSYSKQQNISLDKEAFGFRLLTHPKYPNITSVIDTLAYFEINCDAYSVDFKDIDITPDHYLTFLKGRYAKQDLHQIQKKNNTYYLDSKKTSLAHLKQRWKGIVLLLDHKTTENQPRKSKNKYALSALVLLSILFFTSLVSKYNTIIENLFYIFPIVGLTLSIFSLKDLFKIDSRIFNKFCSISSSANCNAVLNSKKWKVFEKISFSDLSLVFFLSQLISYFVFSISNNTSTYFIYQKILLLGSLPIIVTSIYFQKFIVKKWCPICLAILTTLVLEMVFVLNTITPQFNFDTIQLFIGIQIVLIFGWTYLKKILNKLNYLRTHEVKSTRFLRNYSIFKNAILNKSPITTIAPKNTLADVTITLVTDPFCDHCKNAHFFLEELIKKYPEKLHLDILLNVDIEDEYEEYKLLCQRLITIQLSEGRQHFSSALNDWFKNEDVFNWLDKYGSEINESRANTTFIHQKKWCAKNQIDFAPVVLINGYQYPLIYDIENLDYFIQDLINDSDFLHEKQEYNVDLTLV
ncbi:hypothetical protein D1816_17915 [Aquimarina sp. AD10]|uniref:vitamin K epoxide reductase family protein n=1 Tax=Aquimarina sp. AD10 TaxID=1714849 RepID=UPI000E4CDCBF|nr:vitamin K epoxide reductase family protein [Aquimarina sp. AD10]AXT62154.1 hypothetical protein D1816_17915 [Aquimarina sp. AD10]RKM90651.1 hypothetical protein D7033_24465 [Aquimarina sp. AD10]